MKVSPWILGAAALVPVAGAVAGTQMSVEPIGIGADVTATLPDRVEIAEAGPGRLTRERLPDHYAMDTPEGRVEAADLAWRGRYRDRLEQAYAQADIDAEWAAMEAQWDAASYEAAAQPVYPEATPAEAEVRYVEAPHYAALEKAAAQEPTPSASPRVVDVAYELALRD